MTQRAPLAAGASTRMRDAAEILLAARRDAKPIDALPVSLCPGTLEEAYALQDVMAEALAPIGGWKVGAASPTAAPRCAPMPLWGGYLELGSRLRSSFARLRGIEGEIAFLIGDDLPVRETPYTREEIIAAIVSAHPAIEILESAFYNPDTVDPLSIVGDLQIHGGFCYGPAVMDWQAIDLAAERVEVVIDSAVRLETGMGNPAGSDLLRLVTWLANEGQARTGGLKQGDWITTGSWTGKELAVAGSSVQVSFAHFGTAAFAFDRGLLV